MLSIVIPCYNEATVIKDSIGRVVDFMSSMYVDYELILVNDGSKDNTIEVFNQLDLMFDVVKVYSYKQNKGKGYAINYGLEKCTGDTILFMDADLSTDLIAIKNTIDIILGLKGGYLIIGSRKMEDSVILNNTNRIRKVMSKCCTVLVNKAFKIGVSDSQCGFKCFDRSTKDYLVEKQKVFGWAFDVEYILLARNLGVSVIEIPVKWEYKSNSSVSVIKSSLSYIKELFMLKYLYRKKLGR